MTTAPTNQVCIDFEFFGVPSGTSTTGRFLALLPATSGELWVIFEMPEDAHAPGVHAISMGSSFWLGFVE